MKRKETKIKKKELTRTKVSLVIIFFIDVALAKIVIRCNNYNLCVPRARMENTEDSQPERILQNNEPFVLVACVFYSRL